VSVDQSVMAVTEDPSGETVPSKRKSRRDLAEERRDTKLAFVRDQVANGSLVIRKMTDEERLLYPPISAPRPRRR
jgi:hypothetical protein